MNKNTVGFSFENDSSLLIERSNNVEKIEVNSKGSKAERMARFLKIHAEKVQLVQGCSFS